MIQLLAHSFPAAGAEASELARQAGRTGSGSCHFVWQEQARILPRQGVLELTDVLGATVGINLKTGAVTRTQTSEKGC